MGPSKTSLVSSHHLDSTILLVCLMELPRSDSTSSDTLRSSTDVFPCLPSSDSSPNTLESVLEETSIFKVPPLPLFLRDTALLLPFLRKVGDKSLPSFLPLNSSCATTPARVSSLVTSAPEPSTTDGTPSMRKPSSKSVPSN